MKIIIEVNSFAELLTAIGSLLPQGTNEALSAIEAEDDEQENENPPEVDVNGEVWDDRIHSAGKSINKDGTWRRKRGIAADAPPPPPKEEEPPTFEKLMELANEKQLGLLELNEIARSVDPSLTSIAVVAARPDMVFEVYHAIAAK